MIDNRHRLNDPAHPDIRQLGFTISAAQQWCRRVVAPQKRSRSASSGVHQKGFTIVELMIAITVFSLVLIVILSGVLGFTRAYYKGINSSATQSAARTAMNAMAQAVQFGGATPSPGPGYFCVGTKEFAYKIGSELPAGSYALYQFTPGACIDPATISNFPAGINGQELLGPHMRLAAFNSAQQGTSPLWTISLTVVYGDDDLLTGSGPNTQCKQQTGFQFCSVVSLQTTVAQRITP